MEHLVRDVSELKHAAEICQHGDVFVIGPTRVRVTGGGLQIEPEPDVPLVVVDDLHERIAAAMSEAAK